MSTATDEDSAPPGDAPVEIDSASVTYVRPGLGRWLARSAAAAVLGNLGLLVAAIVLGHLGLRSLLDWLSWVGDLSKLALYASPALAVLSVLVTSVSLPRPGPAAVTVSREGVRVRRGARTRFIPKSKIADGLVIPTAPNPTAVVHLKNGDHVSFVVNTEGEASNSLDKLGISAEQRRTAATLRGPGRQLAAGCVSFGVGTFAAIFALVVLDALINSMTISLTVVLTALMAVTWAVFRSFRPPEVAVGTDGVLLRGAWRSRFIPYARIDGARARDGGPWPASSHLELDIKRGSEVGADLEHVRVGASDVRLVDGLVNRINEVMQKNAGAAEARAEESRARAELLDPRGRPLSAWREALAAVAREEGGYRQRSLSKDDLTAILSDPDAPAGRRIGAAFALLSSRQPEARERVRVAAEACASDPLREALERAAKDELDEATLEQALSEEDVEAKRRS